MFKAFDREELLSKLPNPVVGPCLLCGLELDFAERVGRVCKCSGAYCHDCWVNSPTTQCVKCGAIREKVSARIASKMFASPAEVLVTKARKGICDLAKGEIIREN